jgi:DNA polymerase
MPRADQDSKHPATPGASRRLLAQWLQQKVEMQERLCFLPASGPGGTRSDQPQEERTSHETAAATPQAPRRRPAAGVIAEQSLFDEPREDVGPRDDSMAKIASEVNVCTKCRLHETRDKAVPGVGPDDADLVFIGEGPGADEDRQGEPFVGRAGQLLTKILAAVELGRDEVFITNIVKCRPPNNRDPRPDEIEACEPYLKRQLRALEPKVICTLGRHAAMTLLESKESMARLRTGERQYEGIRLFPTYHPAALLRNPQWKRPVWEDIQKVRKAYDEPREKT